MSFLLVFLLMLIKFFHMRLKSSSSLCFKFYYVLENCAYMKRYKKKNFDQIDILILLSKTALFFINFDLININKIIKNQPGYIMKSISAIQELLALSGKPGNVPVNLMAFFLYLKKIKRLEKSGDNFNAFAMSTDEMEWFSEIIEHMIGYSEKDLHFQIAIAKWDGSEQINHWSFLEFNFIGSQNPPSLDILICDPLGFMQSLVLANLLSNMMKFGILSKLCLLKIYIPVDILQAAGRTCPYFVTDSISMLSNQNKYCPVYDYMNTHQQENETNKAISTLKSFRESMSSFVEEDLDDVYSFDLVVGHLPSRLLRTKHSVTDLENEVQNSAEHRDEIVNSKGETAWASISKNLFFVKDRTGDNKYRNMRVNKKMEKLGENVNEISSTLNSEEDIQLFFEAVHRHRLFSLEKLIGKTAKTFGYTYF